MAKETQPASVNEKVNNFVQKHRTPILVSLILVVVLFMGFLCSYMIINALQKKASSAIEELLSRYEAVHSDIADVSNSDVALLIEDLKAFAQKSSGYAGGKAYGLLAEIYMHRGQFDDMRDAWVNAAKKAGKTFLVPVAWYNAAGAAEQLNNFEQAIEYYTKSLDSRESFPLAGQAQFSIGRLNEELGNTNGALDAYRALISGWPNDTWANIARSRIIVLEIKAQQ